LALVSLDGVTPSRMVGVSVSVNLPMHHKVQKFSSGTGSPGWSRKKGRKVVVVWWWLFRLAKQLLLVDAVGVSGMKMLRCYSLLVMFILPLL